MSSKFFALAFLPFAFYSFFHFHNNRPKEHHGGLTIDIGVPHKKAIFNEDDFKPGDCEEREVKVKNDSKKVINFLVKATEVKAEDNMASAVTIAIEKENKELYFKSLQEFFKDSEDGLLIDTVKKNKKEEYDITVCFDIDAGNQYQKDKIKFDLKFFGN